MFRPLHDQSSWEIGLRMRQFRGILARDSKENCERKQYGPGKALLFDIAISSAFKIVQVLKNLGTLFTRQITYKIKKTQEIMKAGRYFYEYRHIP